MSTARDLEARVIAIIAGNKRVPPESLSSATTFAELQIDSLDALNIAFALEEAFHIAIPDEQLRALKTVGDSVAGVRQLLAEQAGGSAQD